MVSQVSTSNTSHFLFLYMPWLVWPLKRLSLIGNHVGSSRSSAVDFHWSLKSTRSQREMAKKNLQKWEKSWLSTRDLVAECAVYPSGRFRALLSRRFFTKQRFRHDDPSSSADAFIRLPPFAPGYSVSSARNPNEGGIIHNSSRKWRANR